MYKYGWAKPGMRKLSPGPDAAFLNQDTKLFLNYIILYLLIYLTLLTSLI